MNRRGQLVMFGIMMAVILIITTVIFIEPIKDQVTTARASLNCASGSLTTGEEMVCIATDTVLFAFIGVCFSVAIGFVGAKKLGFIGD